MSAVGLLGLNVLVLVGAIGIYVAVHRGAGWVPFWRTTFGDADPTRTLAGELHLEEIEHQLYVLADGSVVGAWEVQGVETELRDPNEIAGDVDQFGAAINWLRPDVEVIVQTRRSPDISGLVQRFREASAPRSAELLFLKRRLEARLVQLASSPATPFLDTRIHVFVRVGAQREGLGPIATLREALVRVWRLRGRYDVATDADAVRAEFRGRVRLFRERTREFSQLLERSPVFRARRLGNRELAHHAQSLLRSPQTMVHGVAPVRRPDPTRFLLADVDRPTRAWIARLPGTAELFPFTVRSQIAAVPYEALLDHVVVDGRCVGVMRMHVAPETVRQDLLAPLRSGLPFPWTYTVRIQPRTKDAELRRLQSKSELAAANAHQTDPLSAGPRKENVRAADEAEQRYHDVVHAVDQQYFATTVTVTFDAATREELNDRAADVRNFFLALHDARVERETVSADRVLRETWPFHVPRRSSRAPLMLLTGEIVSLLPLFTAWTGSPNPVRILRTTAGEPFAFDPADASLQSAQHTGIFGKNGTGKSVVAQTLLVLTGLLKGDVDYCVLDSQWSYRRTAAIFGGAFFEAGDQSPHAVNAFALPSAFRLLPQGEQDEFVAARIAMGVELVLTLGHTDPRDDGTWRAIVSAVLTPLLRTAAADGRELLLRDVRAGLLQYRNPELAHYEQAARELATRLRPYVYEERAPGDWVPGQYARLFDRPQSYDGGTTQYLVADLNKVKLGDPAILSAFVVAIVQGLFYERVVSNRVGREGRATRWIMDECMSYLKNRAFREEAIRALREGRKMRNGVAFLLQGYGDDRHADYGDFALAFKPNLVHRIMLLHDRNAKATRDALHEDGLDHFAEKLFGLHQQRGYVSEAIISQSAGATTRHADILIELDPFEYWATTTDPEDTKVETAYLARYGAGTEWKLTMFEHTYVLAALWPHGAGQPAEVPGIGAAAFPADRIVQDLVAYARHELNACRAILAETRADTSSITNGSTPDDVADARLGAPRQLTPAPTAAAPTAPGAPSPATPLRRARSRAEYDAQHPR